MSTNGKWILRPGKRPVIPEAAKPKTASQWLADKEADAAREARRAERALPPIVRMSRRFGADRRKAFLKAYRAGAKAQGAARAVMVPWGTVRNTLQADAAFRADYEAAKAEAHAGRLRRALGRLVDEVGADEAAAVAQAVVAAVRASIAAPDIANEIRRTVFALEAHCGDVDGPALVDAALLDEVLMDSI